MSSSGNYYVPLLKQCCETFNQMQAKKLHCRIILTLNQQDPFLSNCLISTYSKLSNLVYARKVFDQMPEPNQFSWNIILSAYSKSGCLPQMKQIFDHLPVRDGISWNSFISGYVNYGLFGTAVNAYKLMMLDGVVHLNRITFSTMLILSSKEKSVDLGRQIHGHILKFGFNAYVFVVNPLVDMYSKLGFISDAKRVFDEVPERNLVMYNTMVAAFLRGGRVEESLRLFYCMPEKDSISWTTMITGFTQNRFYREAVDMVREMKKKGFNLDQFTFGSVLTACGGQLALREGKQMHAFIFRTNYQHNVFVGSALVDMYCKCGNIRYAEIVFRRLSHKNVISWTAMVVGYGQNGLSEEAIKIFRELQKTKIDPDDFTFGSVISSCANLSSLEEGAQFHCQALVSGFTSFITVSNALITLYGKCGMVEDACNLFSDLGFKDEVSWTALISAYSQFGKADETIAMFDKMVTQGLMPDALTFLAVISACSRAGLVEKGQQYFRSMVDEHGIVPVSDHYTCIIDLFGRAGRLEEARNFINEMPSAPDAIGWATLLSSCRFHGNSEIGEWAADSLLQLDPQNPAAYVLLISIYASKGKWDYVAQLRKGMRDKGVRKDPGHSWIKFKNKVHIFSADDQSSPYLDQIYAEMEKLYQRMIEAGYVPDLSSVLHEVEDLEKIRILNRHSERLAIVFGLIFLPTNLPIRVFKNLRVCGDCHNATKIISKITRRQILVRDAVRFHLFKDGRCSCGDFW